ncbi:MAG: CoA pyrophosphatase [Desulfobacteraceae bacterium]
MKDLKTTHTACYDVLTSAVKNAVHPEPHPSGRFKPASVIGLVGLTLDPYLLFIEKADLAGYPWRNQMAFPGGHTEPGDRDRKATALRELEEEMGISKAHVEVIGSLGHFQTINSREIEAFIGIWDQQEKICPDPGEISRTFPIPVSHLMKTHREKNFQQRSPDIHELTYPYEDVVIWGVTAKIIHHLLELLHNSAP